MTRLDSLPEYHAYPDRGCDLAPRCLQCPFPTCRYDTERGLLELHRKARSEQIRTLQHQGVPIGDIAQRTGVSRRTVLSAVQMGS